MNKLIFLALILMVLSAFVYADDYSYFPQHNKAAAMMHDMEEQRLQHKMLVQQQQHQFQVMQELRKQRQMLEDEQFERDLYGSRMRDR